VRFCVLQAGAALPGANRRHGGYGGMFARILGSAGHHTDVRALATGPVPAEPAAFAGVVVTGSPHSAHDPVPWFPRFFSFLREVSDSGKPLLGVCFGHQALAHALGGAVAPNPKGWEIGTRRICLTRAGMGSLAGGGERGAVRIFESHRDAVIRLPPGSVLLARSDNTEVEMFSAGRNVLGIQGHPEFDREVVLEIAETLAQRGELAPEETAGILDSLRRPADDRVVRGWMTRFLEGGGDRR